MPPELRLEQQVYQNLRERLVDRTRRNRLLHFKHAAEGTMLRIAVIENHPHRALPNPRKPARGLLAHGSIPTGGWSLLSVVRRLLWARGRHPASLGETRRCSARRGPTFESREVVATAAADHDAQRRREGNQVTRHPPAPELMPCRSRRQ